MPAAGRLTQNNYRYAWDLSEAVGRSERGDYRFRFRFSADGGRSWYPLGLGEGPAGGEFRTLRIRLNSQDDPAGEPYTVDQNFQATHCELYVNALGRGSFSHNGASRGWLRAAGR